MADRFRTAWDWDDVRLFVTLARRGSLSATARALSVNHAPVARRIANLEAALGTVLFERRPDGYVLTAAGRNALDDADAMEAAATRLLRRGPRDHIAGLVRISAPPSLADRVLVPRLAEFAARHPAVDVEIVGDRRSVSLARREADLALRLGAPADGYVVARRIATIAFGLYGVPDWVRKLRQGTEPVFVGFDEASAHLPEAVWLARHFPTARLAFRANSQAAQALAARSGCGIAALPHFIGRQEPDLVTLDLGLVPPPRDLFILHNVFAPSDAAAAAMKDFLISLWEDEPTNAGA